MSKAFDKFQHTKKGSAKKEEYRQQKRAIKKELNEEREKRKAAQFAHNPSTQKHKYSKLQEVAPIIKKVPTTAMPLNKYVAHCGIAGRREAAVLIKEGKVEVNGKLILEPGFKVQATTDVVKVNGQKVFLAKNLVYILLNKPKDYITTTDDPQNRKTVIQLIKNASTERVYPVGRLDRNTTGVLLLTNDGELAQKLTHPKHGVKKIYHVELDKPLTKSDIIAITKGVELEDGVANVDAIGYPEPADKKQVGLEIHSGRNRIVRRIFEHLKYEVKSLDRVMFAGLTKKNIARGTWRMLNEKEVRLLKYMNGGK